MLLVGILLAAPFPLMSQESESGLCRKAHGNLSDNSTVITVGHWDGTLFSESFSDTVGELKAAGTWADIQSLPQCPTPASPGPGGTGKIPFFYGWCGLQPCSPDPFDLLNREEKT